MNRDTNLLNWKIKMEHLAFSKYLNPLKTNWFWLDPPLYQPRWRVNIDWLCFLFIIYKFNYIFFLFFP